MGWSRLPSPSPDWITCLLRARNRTTYPVCPGAKNHWDINVRWSVTVQCQPQYPESSQRLLEENRGRNKLKIPPTHFGFFVQAESGCVVFRYPSGGS